MPIRRDTFSYVQEYSQMDVPILTLNNMKLHINHDFAEAVSSAFEKKSSFTSGKWVAGWFETTSSITLYSS